jgi:hypothetical protein
MRKEIIPFKLHHLLPLVEKWGIEDDGYRDEAVEKANSQELSDLISSITPEIADELDKWFCDPEMLSKPSYEYIKFSVFFMAFEYAKAIMRSRNS